MNQEYIREEKHPSRFELFLDFVKARFWSIIAAIIGIIIVAVYLEYEPAIPREWMLVGLTAISMAPLGYLTGNYIASMLYDPMYIYVLDIDARYTDGALYRFPFEEFKELESRDGQFDQVTSQLYIVKNVDLETMEATGTWRGTLTDRELLQALSKVHETRGMLEQDARRGFTIESQAFSIVRGAVMDEIRTIVETFESGTLASNGESLTRQIDAALDEFDLQHEIDQAIQDEAPQPADIAEKEGEREREKKQSEPMEAQVHD